MAVTKNKKNIILWIRKIGFWGFMFFLLKGLVWVAVIAFGYFSVK